MRVVAFVVFSNSPNVRSKGGSKIVWIRFRLEEAGVNASSATSSVCHDGHEKEEDDYHCA